MHYDLNKKGDLNLWFDHGACGKVKGLSSFSSLSFNHYAINGKIREEAGVVYSNDRWGIVAGLSSDEKEHLVYNEKSWFK
jgi:hypothetical protein